MPRVRYEQAVYGSFPFWDRGYALLAASPGCRSEWLAEFQAVCQRYGEPPPGMGASEAMFSLRLPCGVWAVVGVAPQGRDDRGRPGALAFHGRFLKRREFARIDFDPFQLDQDFRQWKSAPAALPAGTCLRDKVDPHQGRPVSPEAQRIAEALIQGGRVAVEADTPIDELASQVWRALPARVRRRASVATMAYSAAPRFHLMALPRLRGADLDPSYRTPEDLAAPRDSWRGPSRRVVLGTLALGAAIVAGAIGLTQLGGHDPDRDRAGPRPAASPGGATPNDPAPPRPDVAAPVDPDERQRVMEGLLDLAGRFGLTAVAPDDPTALMAAIGSRLRYRGPWLTAAELDRLRADGSPDAARALALHDHLRHFAPDRPLPPDFARGRSESS